MEKRAGTTSTLDATLDTALDALLAGDKQSLLRAIRIVENHPRAKELRRLLTSAIETREAIRATPSAQARVRHLKMIGVACREQGRARAARKARDVKRMRHLVFRPLAIGGAALGLALPGALALASTAQPGDVLYGAKLKVEQVQLALTTSPEAEIALHLKFAERRMDEVERLEEKGHSAGPAVTTAVSNLESHTAAVTQAVTAMSEDGRPPADLTAVLERHRDGISELAGKAGCDRSRSGAGCEELEGALASSMSALKQLKDGPRPGGDSQTLAGKRPGKPRGSGASPADKSNTGGPTKPPETTSASPTTAASESSAAAGGADPSASPSPEPSPSPSPEVSPSPTPSPDPSVSPAPDPAQEPNPGQPVPVGGAGPPGSQTEPPAGASPDGGAIIEPHGAGTPVPTSPLP
ncbi:MAG TPA: DUF5667 domain-containing protein [Actinomycetota bacterium]|jgi:hypothetical protein